MTNEEQFKVAQFSRIDTLLRVQARMEVQALLAQPQFADPKRLERFGFKVFSQNDEDGVIQEIFRRIGTANKAFFEFGAGNCLESNCAYLALQGWSGAWVDGNLSYVQQGREFFNQQVQELKVTITQAMITVENINQVAKGMKLPDEIDLLSIDIDGNDYYVWEALTVLRPRVVVIEYNASFPPPAKLVQAHDPERTWNGTSYFGASLKALTEMAGSKRYTLVGTNLPGVNAFFVRTDLVGNNFAQLGSAHSLFNPPRFALGECGFPVGHPPGIGPTVTK